MIVFLIAQNHTHHRLHSTNSDVIVYIFHVAKAALPIFQRILNFHVDSIELMFDVDYRL